MEPEVLRVLLHSQVPANCPCPETDQSTPKPPFHFLMIGLNIILPSTPGSSKLLLFLRFPQQNPVYASPLPIYATCPAQPILYLITRTIFDKEYRALSSALCTFLHSTVTSSLLCPNIFLNSLFSNTLSLRSSLNVNDQVSTPIQNNGLNYSSV